MKKLLSISLLCMLSACQTVSVPITSKFPVIPEELLVECGPLFTIDKDVVYLSEYTKTVIENYKKYHNCSNMIQAWQNWYKEQKTIFESSTKK